MKDGHFCAGIWQITLGQLAAKCPSLDAKIVNNAENKLELTFGLFNFEVVGRRYEFFGL